MNVRKRGRPRKFPQSARPAMRTTEMTGVSNTELKNFATELKTGAAPKAKAIPPQQRAKLTAEAEAKKAAEKEIFFQGQAEACVELLEGSLKPAAAAMMFGENQARFFR